MKEVFIVSESEDIFSMFSGALSYLPVHFSWVGDMDVAEKQFRNEKPDFVFFAVNKLTLLHNWVARYKSFKLKTPFLCFISKIGWEKRELLWMAGAAEVIELPKLNKEFRQIVESILVSSTEENADSGLSGSLSLMNVINLIQTFQDGKKNGIIELISKNRVGQLQFYKGKLVNAQFKSQKPLDAVLAMSLWREGVYTISLDKTRHAHKLKLENEEIIKECQNHILAREKLLNSLPDREVVFYASPLLDYEKISAADRKSLLFFKFGKSLNGFLEKNSEGSLEFLKGIDNWVENGSLIEKEEYQKQQLKIKEQKNQSGVKKIIDKIFSKKVTDEEQSSKTQKTVKNIIKENSHKKSHLFDRYEVLAEFGRILEN
ncbi:MAG: DUF4388 domain-containing protein [Calditrichaeota bacterium]|nr:MAG: DUF4388 domain-containing protein [Calditrichota bacterium]MBL1206774.1 DUF4388 domain-containing protein [Calditrichota bacterium]NOG46600.1 DUF4388 domain-containing protein [Calditrichota bacterium]